MPTQPDDDPIQPADDPTQPADDAPVFEIRDKLDETGDIMQLIRELVWFALRQSVEALDNINSDPDQRAVHKLARDLEKRIDVSVLGGEADDSRVPTELFKGLYYIKNGVAGALTLVEGMIRSDRISGADLEISGRRSLNDILECFKELNDDAQGAILGMENPILETFEVLGDRLRTMPPERIAAFDGIDPYKAGRIKQIEKRSDYDSLSLPIFTALIRGCYGAFCFLMDNSDKVGSDLSFGIGRLTGEQFHWLNDGDYFFRVQRNQRDYLALLLRDMGDGKAPVERLSAFGDQQWWQEFGIQERHAFAERQGALRRECQNDFPRYSSLPPRPGQYRAIRSLAYYLGRMGYATLQDKGGVEGIKKRINEERKNEEGLYWLNKNLGGGSF